MTGAHPTEGAQYELQRAIEGEPTRTSYGYGPGGYVYWSLVHHITASDVLFADFAPDRDQTTYNSRSGRLFIVTSGAFVIAEYRCAAEEADGDPNQEFGTLDLTFYPHRPDSIASLDWPGRSLRIPVDRFRARPVATKLERGAIKLKGAAWDISLPGDTQDDGDGYVARLRTALGM